MKRKTCKQYIVESQQGECVSRTKQTVRFVDEDKSETYFDMYIDFNIAGKKINSVSFESVDNLNFNAI